MTPQWDWRRPPPWWPDNEPWPPRGPRQQANWARRGFLWRISALFLFLLILASIGTSSFVAVAGDRFGVRIPREVVGLAFMAFMFLVMPTMFFGGMRRFGIPLGDIVSAAERIGRGDYGVRLTERGPLFLRKVARAFNGMTAKLQTQEQQRRELMADVAHELRTPLAVMRGRLEGLLDGVYQRDDAAVEQLIEETIVLERLVEDLRTLAHTEGGTLRLQRETTDLGVLIGELAKSFASIAQSRQIALTTAAVDLPLMDLDPFRIRQVLSNLVANALAHTPSGGHVTLRAVIEAANVRIDVEDSGPGIPNELLGKIFDRFAKGVHSKGSGLGLAITRGLVRAHGGDVSARNRPEGGAVFSVRLPTVPSVSDARE